MTDKKANKVLAYAALGVLGAIMLYGGLSLYLKGYLLAVILTVAGMQLFAWGFANWIFLVHRDEK